MEYCEVDDCAKLTDGHGPMCSMHAKRQQRLKKRGGKGKALTAPAAERLNPKQKLLELAIDLADAKAELSDDAYRAKERAYLAAASVQGRRQHIEAIREALRQRTERGLKNGRPPKLDPAAVAECVAATGSQKRAAEVLRVSVRTVRRAQKQKDCTAEKRTQT